MDSPKGIRPKGRPKGKKSRAEIAACAKAREQELLDTVKNFDSLPDSAWVSDAVIIRITGLGRTTLWRKAGREFPAPRMFGKLRRTNVGELRQALSVK